MSTPCVGVGLGFCKNLASKYSSECSMARLVFVLENKDANISSNLQVIRSYRN